MKTNFLFSPHDKIKKALLLYVLKFNYAMNPKMLVQCIVINAIYRFCNKEFLTIAKCLP